MNTPTILATSSKRQTDSTGSPQPTRLSGSAPGTPVAIPHSVTQLRHSEPVARPASESVSGSPTALKVEGRPVTIDAAGPTKIGVAISPLNGITLAELRVRFPRTPPSELEQVLAFTLGAQGPLFRQCDFYAISAPGLGLYREIERKKLDVMLSADTLTVDGLYQKLQHRLTDLCLRLPKTGIFRKKPKDLWDATAPDVDALVMALQGKEADLQQTQAELHKLELDFKKCIEQLKLYGLIAELFADVVSGDRKEQLLAQWQVVSSAHAQANLALAQLDTSGRNVNFWVMNLAFLMTKQLPEVFGVLGKLTNQSTEADFYIIRDSLLTCGLYSEKK